MVILGSGPNRIGQGIEFDYCCVHAAMTVRASGRDAVMVNCNPETVSTDYDTSDRLYFEPLTLEDVLGVIELEQPEGVIVQFGGQTPLKLAQGLVDAGVPLLGTPVESIHLAEDRPSFGAILDELGLKSPPYATATSPEQALTAAEEVGYPLLVRPSYVLGGRAMEICYSRESLDGYLQRTAEGGRPEGDIFLDRFLENAIEVDVDALCDGETVRIGAVMQHVEEAGIHSGDSACVIPAMSLGPDMHRQVEDAAARIALRLGVVGLINIQFAVYGDDELYVIEANPRASRTVPFVSKAVGVPLAKVAARLMLGERLADMELALPSQGSHVSVKEAVLPFGRFPRADSLLGPEMKSTGEVMGVAQDYPTAFGKAQAAAGAILPSEGTVFISVTDGDKPTATQLAASLHDLGFTIMATGGTAQAIRRMGVPVERIQKLSEGSPNVVEAIDAGRRRPGGEHADGLGRARRRVRDPPRGRGPRRALHHHHERRQRRPAGHPRRAWARRRRSPRSRSCTRLPTRSPHERPDPVPARAPGGRGQGRAPPGRLRPDHRPRPGRPRGARSRASSTCWPRATGGVGAAASARSCPGPSRTRARAGTWAAGWSWTSCSRTWARARAAWAS